MSFITPDYFIHAANILLLVAYSVRDSVVALVRGGSLPQIRQSALTTLHEVQRA
jgi:hypothetical protein